MVFEAQGDAVVVRSARTGEVLHHLRSQSAPVDPNKNVLGEKLRLRARDDRLRAHFDFQYKSRHSPEEDNNPVVAESRKSQWVSRQVAKFAISPDHLSHVTAFALHPTQSNQLLIATADHLLRIWDIAQGLILETFQMKAPIVWMAASQLDPALLLCVVNDTPRVEREIAFAWMQDKKPKQDKDAKDRTQPPKEPIRKRKWTVNLHGLETTHWTLLSFNLSKGIVENTVLERQHRPFYGAAMQQQRTLCSSHPFINAVALIAGSELFVCRVGVQNTGDVVPRKINMTMRKHVRPLTCVAIHPTAEEVRTQMSFVSYVVPYIEIDRYIICMTYSRRAWTSQRLSRETRLDKCKSGKNWMLPMLPRRPIQQHKRRRRVILR
jgi:hypothetical protein